VSHLGERITALVDGELGHDERDRVLAHLAACAPCRAEAEAQRRLKQRLHSLGDASPTSDLLSRLYAMGEPGGPIPPRIRPVPGTAKPPVVARPSARRPGGAHGPGFVLASAHGPAARLRAARGPGDRGHGGPGDRGAGGRHGLRLPRARYLVGAAAIAVLGIGTAGFVAGGEQSQLPRVAPAIDQFAVEHALTSGDVPVTDREPAEEPTPNP
jgi:anti-sigma factor RsiW